MVRQKQNFNKEREVLLLWGVPSALRFGGADADPCLPEPAMLLTGVEGGIVESFCGGCSVSQIVLLSLHGAHGRPGSSIGSFGNEGGTQRSSIPAQSLHR